MAGLVRILIFILAGTGVLLVGRGLWLPAKALTAQILLHRAWETSQQSREIVKPWPWADTWPVGRLIAERAGVDQIILEGQNGEALAFGPGHLPASAQPGKDGHCILSGHRDSSFAFLQHLQPGDELVLEGLSGTEKYLVEKLETVPTDSLYLNTELSGTLTLITCYPFRAVLPNTPLRFVVTAVSAAP